MGRKKEPISEYIPIMPEDEESIEILKVKIKCWKCKEDVDAITYHSQYDGMDNYLGSIPFVDEMLLKKYPSLLEKRYSKTQEDTDIVNVCKKCNNIQGNFFQWEIREGIETDSIKPETLEIISVRISDLLSKEDLDIINEQIKDSLS